jgi:ADP-ribose pyrophosphatase YjhB (NUDIX family)
MEKDRHCSHCGVAFAQADGAAYPRTCASCKNVTYKNPIPVAVLLLPVDDGLLGIKRGIEPKKGMLALPGGFVDYAETWQEGAARELFEETNIVVDPNLITDFAVRSVGKGGPILIFGVAPKVSSKMLPDFAPTNETLERVVVSRGQQLAFPLHAWAMEEFFVRRG